MDHIRDLITQNRIREALDELAKNAPRPSIKSEISLLKANFNDLENQARIGLISRSQVNMERTRIVYAALGLIDRIERMVEGREISASNYESQPENAKKHDSKELNFSHRDLSNFSQIPSDIFDNREEKIFEINLSNNNFSVFPYELLKFKNLEFIDLSNNKISYLPTWVSQLTRLKEVNLRGNNFNIPEEIYDKPAEELIDFIFNLQSDREASPLNECKLIVIGSGGVGKTSLIKSLLEQSFDPAELKTDGIDIKHMEVQVGAKAVRLNIWDFGGQEIMHATHRIFMTKRSIYLIVVNARLDDKYGDDELDYWLKLVNSYSPKSPIIVAVNKADIHRADYGVRSIKASYENIIDFCETSSASNTGIDTLQALINTGIGQLSHLSEVLPNDFYLVRSELEAKNEDYIQYHQYLDLCKEVAPKASEDQIKTYIKLLNDLGIMLNISENRYMEDTQVLNPEWITNGVYSIINSSLLLDNKGIISEGDLKRILDRQMYPTNKERGYIIDMMENFELCYRLPDQRDKYFIPGAFPKDQPEELTFDEDFRLQFFFQFDILPSSVMSRFIVKIHPFIQANNFWRNGVILVHSIHSRAPIQALVTVDIIKKRILIKLSGEGNPRATLSYIRTEFKKIFQSIDQLGVHEMIPIEGHLDNSVKYADLLAFEAANEETIFIPSLLKRFSVKALLNGIEERIEGQELKKLIGQGKLDEVLEKLIIQFQNNNEVIGQISRLNRLNREIRNGTISQENKDLNLSKITNALLELIDEYWE